MSTSADAIQKRWSAAMRAGWKDFSRRWTRIRRHSSSDAVHKMRSASRRLASSICVAALSAGIPAKRATEKLDQISDHLGPLRDNHVYRETLDRLKASANVRSFSRFLARQKSDEQKQLDRFFHRHHKRGVHRRFDRIERKLQRLSKDWTAGDYRTAFEKVLRRRYEALIRSQQDWRDSPDDKRFHRMRVEVRDLRYASEAISGILGLSHTRDIHSVLKMLRSLQTSMGKIHDIHKLRTELVAWINSRPAKKRALEMTVAADIQQEFEHRMVEFKDHCLASEDLLLSLQVPGRRTIRATAAANSSD